jgi:uncharacterized protein YbaR (Trm112 family)
VRSLDPALRANLVCPRCRGALHDAVRAEQLHLRCLACARAYPVVDGVPHLIPERAVRWTEAG